MATGLQASDSNHLLVYRLVEDATAANSAPVEGTTEGIRIHGLGSTQGRPVRDATVLVYSTAGSGTMTLSYVRLWGRLAGTTRWFPLGTGSDADKGKINQNTPGTVTAFGETGANVIRHAEPILYPGHFDFLYAEVGVFGGTATAINVDVVVPRGD